MADLILTTFDWVPEMPRGYVRDIRVRRALEEASLPYRVESVSFGARNAEHFAHQPFGQVPWLTDGELSLVHIAMYLLPAVLPHCLADASHLSCLRSSAG
jgi:glutathione S-transferase